VAVHGLGANPKYAWVWNPKNNPPGSKAYPAKPVNWLVDLLPQVIPQPCRIMTFNYDSTWIFDAPQQRLSTISDELLMCLRNKREKVGLVFDRSSSAPLTIYMNRLPVDR
jgi:hypothetical protein